MRGITPKSAYSSARLSRPGRLSPLCWQRWRLKWKRLVWEAAWKLDHEPDGDATAEAYLAKEYADKTVLMVTDGAVQTLGGHGYIREHPVERWLRNGRGFVTFDGMAII